MVSSPILLDYQSSTPCHAEVVESMSSYWTKNFANPSSKSNLAGISASAVLEASREIICQKLDIQTKKVIFTSGATESNNLALIGFARNFYQRTGRLGNIVTLKTEHHAVLEPIEKLKQEGFTTTEIVPNEDGLITEEIVRNAFKPDTFLVSIMFANNEIGVVQPLRNIAKICKLNGIILHSDFAQCLGYIPLPALDSVANMITLSSHKIYGPKGVGLLLVDKDIQISPLFAGGGQEFGFRPGTIPLPLIVGFAKAIELAVKHQEDNTKRLSNLRDYLLRGLLENNPEIIVNGSLEERLPHNLNITIPKVRGSFLHKHLKPKIVCSSGSACSNGRPSHVLLALGKSKQEAEASIRFSIGLMTTKEEIEEAIIIISRVIREIRN